MRRGIGIAGLQNASQFNSSFNETGQELSALQLEQLKANFETLKVGLEAFAKKHKEEILNNPSLRAHFAKMCMEIGIDPLNSSKGFWSETLGIGNFYYELALQIIEICFSTREENGGLVDLKLLLERLEKLRGSKSARIDRNDVIRAIEALDPLGSGYKIIQINDRQFVQSIPRTFSQDQTQLLKAAESTGRVVFSACPGWTEERFQMVLNALVKDSLVWIDKKTAQGRPEYYFVSFIQ